MATGFGLGVIGAAIIGGSATAMSAIAIGALASAVVGAVVGGLVAAVSGGDIGKGMLFGAIGGIAIGAAFGTALGAGGILGAGGEAAAGEAASLAAGGTMLGPGAAGVGGEGVFGTTATVLGPGGVEAAGVTAGETLAATTLAGGAKTLYEGEVASEAAEALAEEQASQRAFLSAESDKALANALERAKLAASGGPDFYLAEKQALSKTDTDEAIRRYEAQVATDVKAAGEASAGTAAGILELDLPTRGQYVEGPEGITGISRIGATV